MEVTFLREEDIWGDHALEVIQAYGTAVGISDVAIALGTGCGGTKDIAGVTSGCVWLASSHLNMSVPSIRVPSIPISLINEKLPVVRQCWPL